MSLPASEEPVVSESAPCIVSPAMLTGVYDSAEITSAEMSVRGDERTTQRLFA
jgi:hypothetical protein